MGWDRGRSRYSSCVSDGFINCMAHSILSELLHGTKRSKRLKMDGGVAIQPTNQASPSKKCGLVWVTLLRSTRRNDRMGSIRIILLGRKAEKKRGGGQGNRNCSLLAFHKHSISQNGFLCRGTAAPSYHPRILILIPSPISHLPYPLFSTPGCTRVSPSSSSPKKERKNNNNQTKTMIPTR